MSVNTEGLTLENFKEKTGQRFRCTKAQAAAIKGGTLTRQQAFEQWVASQNATPQTTATDSPAPTAS